MPVLRSRSFGQKWLVCMLAAWLAVPPQLLPSLSPSSVASERSLAAEIAAPVTVSDSQAANTAERLPNDLTPAFVQDVDLGEGERAVILSTTPLNYLAADGSWQPIDPRFEMTDEGYVSPRNLLQIAVSAHSATLQVQLGSTIVGWQHVSLALIEGGETTTLAETLTTAAPAEPSTDGRALTWRGGWTLASLSDEIVAGAGEVEHNVVFGAQPDVRADGDAILQLSGWLRLLPDTQLFADGKVQVAAFETQGSIEIHDAQGRPQLTLSPAWVYEQANPNVGTLARYRLEPQTDGAWLVHMQTRWSWWSDPARQYPVVFDPGLAVIRPTDLAQVQQFFPGPPLNATCLSHPGAVGVGVNGACGEVRTSFASTTWPRPRCRQATRCSMPCW